MKVTIHNYKQAEDKINWGTASPNLVKGKALTAKGITKYEQSEPIQKAIDMYFLLLEKSLPQEKTKPGKAVKPKATPIQRAKPVKKVATPREPKSPKKETPQSTAASVEHIPSDIALVKRYVGLHEKVKTYDQILSVWRAFEKAIVERKVTKESPYKTEIAAMSGSLKSALGPAGTTGSLKLEIPPAKLKVYKTIAESVEKSAGVSILMEFINISGKAGIKERATRLSKRITKAMESGKLASDRYLRDIKKAQTEIEAYLNSETDVVTLNDYSLSGIGEIAVFGCSCDKSLSGFNRSQNAVILKLIQEKVKNLQDSELNRAFNDTVAPGICKTIVQKLVQARQLTMSMIRNPAKAVKSNLTLNGSEDKHFRRHKEYDFGTEIIDIRLRNAAAQQRLTAGKQNKSSGLGGIAETQYNPDPASDVKIMSASELVNKKFETMGLQGKYRKLIGDPEPGFSAMIFGKPKQGKSTVAIDMAKEFTRYGKVLYCAFEEGHGYTLQDKVKRNNANVPGLDFANKLPPFLSAYKFVFIDSVSDAGLDEVAFKALIKANKPQTSILGIFHATKDGKFRGGQTFAHDVDVLIKVDSGVAASQGRFAPPSQISIANLSPSDVAMAA